MNRSVFVAFLFCCLSSPACFTSVEESETAVDNLDRRPAPSMLESMTSMMVEACPQDDLHDDMLRVGDDWCVDRRENVLCDSSLSGAEFSRSCISQTNNNNHNGGGTQEPSDILGSVDQVVSNDGTIINGNFMAYSINGMKPTRFLTFDQAKSMCEHSGKTLVPGRVFDEAQRGTFFPGDPGQDEIGVADERCRLGHGSVDDDRPNLRPSGLAGRKAGASDSCVSSWGIEDLIGNLYEWTDEVSGGAVRGHPHPRTGLGREGAVAPLMQDRDLSAWLIGFRCARKHEFTSLEEPPTSGVYRIVNRQTRECLGLAAADASAGSDGRNLSTASCGGHSDQLWNIVPSSESWINILNRASGRCMDLKSANHEDDSLLWEYGCNGTDAQRWSVRKTNGFHVVVSRESVKCAYADGGGRVRQRSCVGSEEQLWEFVSIQ